MSDEKPRNEEETLDHLAGDWQILQLAKGHRFSTDDMATAWRGARCLPQAQEVLDLGCGIGSVGLMVLHRLGSPTSTLVGVEAQEISVKLARRTVELNRLADRVEIIHGDLRDEGVLPKASRFELITGSPPYVPLGHGLVSPHPQRAGARIELRGSVNDYCLAARRWMAPGGRFCFVMAAADPRAESAPVEAGLVILERYDFVFRAGRAPHIATMVCAREEDGPHPPRELGELVVRGADGQWTQGYLGFRSEMGMTQPPRKV
ncbi:MAG: methyltransferase [Proteobacteria bacterium]|nr:methyltransferase [Pseudomonadota bacterium]